MTLNTKSELAAAIAARKSKVDFHSHLFALLSEIALVIIIIALVFTFVFGITVQHGNDMYPAIKDGDVVLYFRTHKLVNTEPCVYKADGALHTGRVEATGGTEISATGDMQLTFDGIYKPISESDGIYARTYAADGEPIPTTIKDGYYFVLGDNRESARDSRVYGQISNKNMKGRIVTVLRRRQI